ncbi:MAG: hypothetical protein ACR2GT_12680 [Gaiellaceae bacterium]
MARADGGAEPLEQQRRRGLPVGLGEELRGAPADRLEIASRRSSSLSARARSERERASERMTAS